MKSAVESDYSSYPKLEVEKKNNKIQSVTVRHSPCQTTLKGTYCKTCDSNIYFGLEHLC